MRPRPLTYFEAGGGGGRYAVFEIRVSVKNTAAVCKAFLQLLDYVGRHVCMREMRPSCVVDTPMMRLERLAQQFYGGTF